MTVCLLATVVDDPLPDTEKHRYRGRAPQVDSFTEEKPEIRFKNWLLSFYEVSKWNRWCEVKNLMQLVGGGGCLARVAAHEKEQVGQRF